MAETLQTIRHSENTDVSKSLDVPANELGNQLIELYYSSASLRTRQLITLFMTEAGAVWLRKLLMRDTGPIESSVAPFATLNDYINLVAANDSDIFRGLTG